MSMIDYLAYIRDPQKLKLLLLINWNSKMIEQIVQTNLLMLSITYIKSSISTPPEN